ncbi:cytochrome P450 [Brasilonema sp. UFV-L1]|uniref:cytochrome P450 n=1 Tax=Brasilonema sp. UFV-L1 TaxID=2234130 RepID=UPI00249F6796|nr:cytochrome P450 [Brasilonema sp. UFV-L1]
MVLKILNVKLESSNPSENIAPPSPPGLPILGHIPFMGKYQYLTFNNLAKKYGDVFQFRLGAIPLVVLNGVDTIKQALIKQHDDFSGRGKFYLLQNAAGGLTMGAAEYGLLWKRHREIAYNSMHMFIGNKQASIEQMVLEEATELVNILLSYAGQPVDPGVDIGVAVENVIFRILFGERNSRDDQDYEILVKTVGEFVSNFPGALTIDVIPQFRFISRIFDRQRLEKLHLFLEAMHRLLLKRIEQHEASYNPENIRDMTDALLKAVSELDETEKQTIGLTKKRVVRATVQEMMGTALEPNFSVVRWALLYMIAYPQVQAEIG